MTFNLMKKLPLIIVAQTMLFAGFCSAKSSVPQKVKPKVFSTVDQKAKMIFVNIQFPKKYAKDLKYNFDGPWKFKANGDVVFGESNKKGTKKLSLKVDRKSKSMPMFNSSKGRFEIPYKSLNDKKSTMKVTYFYCTKEEGGWCRRIVEEGPVEGEFKVVKR